MFPSLAEIQAWLSGFVQSILSGIISTFQTLGGWMVDIFRNIQNWLAYFINEIKVLVQNVTNYLSTYVTSLVNTIRDAFQSIVDHISAIVTTVMQSVNNFLGGLWDWIVGAIQSGVNYLKGLYLAAVDAIKGAIQTIVTPVLNYFKEISDVVKSAVQTALNTVQEAGFALVDSIKASFDTVLGEANSLIEGVNARLTDVKDAFANAADTVLQGITGLASDQLEPIRLQIGKYTDSILAAIDYDKVKLLEHQMAQLLGPNPTVINDRAGFAEVFKAITPQSGLGSLLFHIFFAISFATQAYSGIGNAQAQVLLQEFATQYPYQLLPPAEVIQGIQQGDIAPESGIATIQRQGYSQHDALQIIKNAEQVPPVGELLAMELRGIQTPRSFQESVKRLGFTQAWAQAYLELAEIIPPVSDLIMMAVKEAFDDATSELFRTDEGFPQEFAEWAKKQGLTEKWAQRYWRAHWSLPSPSQGFEMLQRGIIKDEELAVLLKALDIMPFWRDKLTQMSYNVLTRVDVRRLHALGMLDHSGLVKAHRDMGYNPNDAELLAQFTEALNKGKGSDDEVELGRLSRTSILGFYGDGIIDRNKAYQLLLSFGHTPEGAELYLQDKDHDIERAARKLQVDTILDAAEAGLLTFSQAEDRIHALELATVETERAMARLLRAQAKHNKLPTRDEGERMFAAQVINEAQYRDLLSRLGYSQSWVDAFVTLARKEKPRGN